MAGKFVVVTTSHRGVFGGVLAEDQPPIAEIMKTGVVALVDAQMCVHWDGVMHGVLGLASIGPNKECRVGPQVPVPIIHINNVDCVMEATEVAKKAWEKMPWAK